MTGTRRTILSGAGSVGTLAAMALLVAACGSSSGSNKASSPSASGGSAAAAAKLTITTTRGSAGTYLVGASGRAIYLWVADTTDKSVCSGECAKIWPPVLASATPSVSGGVSASDLGLTTRANGQKQVTYNGHPLYYYIADHGSGMTTGQGNDGFGAKWWLVAPSGNSITKSSSAGSSSSSAGGYGGSGGGYG